MEKDLFYDIEEHQYLETQSIYNIENKLLPELSKKDALKIIKLSDEKHLIKKLNYLNSLSKSKRNNWYEGLNDLSKMFIEQYYFYFNGGEELENESKIIEKRKRFYQINYLISNNNGFFDFNKVPIEDVILLYINLDKNKLNKNIRCPIHKDRTPSFKIYKNTNSFHCFGCNSSGNVLNFISLMEGITTKEAYKKLKKLYFNNKNYE